MHLAARQTPRSEGKEARIVAEDQPTNNGVPEEAPARRDVDVLLDVSELEVDRIHLAVRGLRAHVSVLAELASLDNQAVRCSGLTAFSVGSPTALFSVIWP